MDEVVEALEKYQGLVPLVYDIETMSLVEARSEDMQYAVYLKREADKAIAEKDEKIDLYKRGWEESDKINASIYAELRHQKYKRCLAMADKCESMCYWFSARFDHHELVDNVKWELFDRWRLRWAKLAEKFKESK